MSTEMFEVFVRHPEVTCSVLLVSLCAGALSPLIVMQRLAFFGDAVAHSTMLGVSLGLIAGLLDPLWSMLAVAIGVAMGIALLRSRMQNADTLLGVAMAVAMALGILVYYRYAHGYADMHQYLFGDLVLLPRGWLVWFAVVTLAAVGIVFWLFNRLVAIAVCRDVAASKGVPTRLYDLALVTLLAIVVTLGVKTVGVLMVNALLVIPGACARHMCTRLASYFWVSVMVCVAASAAGLAWSYNADLPPGPAVVAVAGLCFGLSMLVGLGRGRRNSP